jgi:phosphohistidine phosphatase
VLVYLCRHAEATPGEPDELRPLTPDGEHQAKRLGERLAAASKPPVVVLSSPLLRARQTAEAISQATGAELRVDSVLSPGATAQGLRDTVTSCPSPVATVGHQPDCSEIALVLTGADPGFPPGGMAPITLAP